MSKELVLVRRMTVFSFFLVMLFGCNLAQIHTKSIGDEMSSLSSDLDNDTKTFYQPSEALKNFALENPSCLLWSDWQSLCSYSGVGGSVVCHDDPFHRVEPSAPFCANEVDLTKVTSDQLDSMNRFCSLLLKTPLLNRAPIQEVDACYQYADERPFSGRDMLSLDHEWCNAWFTDKGWIVCNGYEDKLLTSGKKISDIAQYSCDEAISRDIKFEKAWCAQWIETKQCVNPQFRGNGVSYKNSNPLKEIITGRKAHVPLPSPTLGVFCGE